MSLYVDTSALLKRYVDESDSDRAAEYLLADTAWFTARLTHVEVTRNLARMLDATALQAAKLAFAQDWRRMHVVELDETTCSIASGIAELTGVRTLDALHLAAARRVGGAALTFLTFDIRQAQAARELTMTVVGC